MFLETISPTFYLSIQQCSWQVFSSCRLADLLCNVPRWAAHPAADAGVHSLLAPWKITQFWKSLLLLGCWIAGVCVIIHPWHMGSRELVSNLRSCPTFRGEKPVSLDVCCKSLLLISEMCKLLFGKFYLIYFLPPFLLLLLRVQRAAKLNFGTQKLDVSLNMPSFSLPSFSSSTITIACLTAFSCSFYWMCS